MIQEAKNERERERAGLKSGLFAARRRTFLEGMHSDFIWHVSPTMLMCLRWHSSYRMMQEFVVKQVRQVYNVKGQVVSSVTPEQNLSRAPQESMGKEVAFECVLVHW